MILNFTNPSEEVIYLLCFSISTSFLLGKTLCSLYNELMNSKEAAEKKRLKHFKP
ncbi:MAG: hypothetical protein II567_03980 [Candidatus Riflebacteria bacterium]|jgi:hypothetical protein|nr:hypothetical protein [Candidatus Riflebacteria bacterium]